jgi:ATP-binding protein involved in chromosome partitioning
MLTPQSYGDRPVSAAHPPPASRHSFWTDLVCENARMPTKDQVTESLRSVIDPELRRDIVELGMVRSIEVHPTGVVDVMVSLTTPGCPTRSHFQTGVAQAVGELDGATGVNVSFDVLSDKEKSALGRKLGRGTLPDGALARVRNVVCIGSGKGGVGKSSVTANLAAALAVDGKQVGVLDADVWGYSQPRMLGLGAERPEVNAAHKLIPITALDGIKVMSIGFFVEQDAAVVWRGPMLHKALQQFLEDVEWGELDYLLIDLPPGTGDVSMTLAQLLPQAKFLIVTTPQPVAQKVARRSAEMATKVKLEIAGVIENMSGFVTPTGERFQLFGEGGGQRLAEELEVPLLAKVPLTMALREQSDAGVPVVFSDPDDPAAQALRHGARGLIALSPIELPVMQAPSPAPPPPPAGMSLPMA